MTLTSDDRFATRRAKARAVVAELNSATFATIPDVIAEAHGKAVVVRLLREPKSPRVRGGSVNTTAPAA